jgi:hypothetical protein
MHARKEASPPSSSIGNVIGTGVGAGTDIGAEIGNVTVTHVVHKPERNSKRPTMPASPAAKKVREAGGAAGIVLALLLATAGKASAAEVGLEAAPPQPVVTPAGETAATKDQAPKAEEEAERPVKLGAAGGIGFPRPLSVEGFVTVKRYVLVGGEYSVLPKVNVGGTDTTMWALAADARVFPFGGAFFIGVRGGRQHLGTRTTVTVTGVGSLSETLDVDTWFVNPRVGFAWTWSSGFTLGLDAGIQIPLKSNVSSNLPAAALADSRVTSVSDAFGKRVLPTVDLLRVGFVL